MIKIIMIYVYIDYENMAKNLYINSEKGITLSYNSLII